ncbi:MAG: adenylate/guanylate cyclase domain-containing protein [Phenylobacterium sp.]|uniref:adenylate/guanylate cyclase domain-containing protein n=1 Tax=Phenylobacterium sp. TaxID=1871053 RepID=UPI001A50949B|nr:adenylate/guanylate cyclase domain-containing protein [Phenylobacterium sp.]MBL8773728.1 adenylate/guanylate cyclase domain-containing protein [Phenylobacterium sp.]
MPSGVKRSGVLGSLLALRDRLRASGGKGLADALVLAGVTVVAASLALAMNVTTPVRFVENLTYDFRLALGVPPAQPGAFAIVKVDDLALNAMRDSSECRCLAPINKAWLADVLVALDAKGVKAIGLDYLLDTWSSDEEFEAFSQRIAGVKAPIVAVVDPAMTPGVDFKVSPKIRYSDAKALILTDYDGVVRRYDPRPGKMPALATEVGIAAVGLKPPAGPFDIRYRAPDPTVEAENAGAIAPSFSAALVEFIPANQLKDKIVFIGRTTRAATADADTPVEDMHTTPLRFLEGHYRGTPGVEVHVHALSQMMAGDQVKRSGPLWTTAIVLFSALFGSFIGRSTQSWWVSVGIVFLGIGIGAAGAVLLYKYTAVMVPMVAPAWAFAFGFFLLSRLSAAELQNQRAFYSSTLERYLAPQVIDRMVGGQEQVKIGAEEREITVMISDLENFSNLVASLPLETFEGVINEYFDGVIDILWKHEAMIDKMTGDGIIAIFGAPVPYEDHADRAIACCREIDVYALEIRERMIARGIKFGYTRMGLSSGIGLVGNFGGERRFNYTAYGEVVVIAARLEAANKTFGTRILFSGDTLKLAKRDVPIEAVGEIDLKGVPVPIPAYTTPTVDIARP